MQKHHMKLATELFNNIAIGKKVIESRLFDEKRRQIHLGDHIIFEEKGKPGSVVDTLVKGLLRYHTFKELFADHDPVLFGENSREFLLKQIKQFYSDEDEDACGVVGIRIERLCDND